MIVPFCWDVQRVVQTSKTVLWLQTIAGTFFWLQTPRRKTIKKRKSPSDFFYVGKKVARTIQRIREERREFL